MKSLRGWLNAWGLKRDGRTHLITMPQLDFGVLHKRYKVIKQYPATGKPIYYSLEGIGEFIGEWVHADRFELEKCE